MSGSRPRNDGLIRVLAIWRLLQDGRWTLTELAARYRVSTRTIRRDLIALQVVGIPVAHSSESDDNQKGLWWIR